MMSSGCVMWFWYYGIIESVCSCVFYFGLGFVIFDFVIVYIICNRECVRIEGELDLGKVFCCSEKKC